MGAQLAEPGQKMESVAESHYDARYGHHIFLHDGIAYTPDVTRSLIDAIETFPMDRRDVIVAGYPKSGTNWLNITLANLYPGWGTTSISGGQVPELTVPDRPQIGFAGTETCLRAPAPRLSKTHVPFEHLPAAFREQGVGKAIYITRNPKDVADAYMNQLKGWLPADRTWEEFLDTFLEGKVFFGSWLGNVLSWHARGEADGVLHVSFEGMRREKRRTIERIVDFVGPVSPDTIDRVMADTEFEAMQSNELGKQYQPQMVRRSGKSGGWRSRFTPEQSRRLDEAFGPALAKAGIEIDYGS